VQTPPRVDSDISHASYTVAQVDWCCAVKTPEDEGRQLESDPLRNPELVEFLEQRRHDVIELPGTENNPSSGMEDGLQPSKLSSR